MDSITTARLTLRPPEPNDSPEITRAINDWEVVRWLSKVPYPYLGDKLVRKKMNKWDWWYPLQTAKSVVEAVGRSVRSHDDFAVTYILDDDWHRFYERNVRFFPMGFRNAIMR